MSLSKALLYFCLSFIFGIFVASFFDYINYIILGLFLISLIKLILVSLKFFKKEFFKKLQNSEQNETRVFPFFAILALCLLSFIIGFYHFQTWQGKPKESEIRYFNNIEENVRLKGIIAEEPDLRPRSLLLTVNILEKNDQKIGGRVLVITRPQYFRYGDKIEIKGKLEAPQKFNGFDYPMFLSMHRIYTVVRFPEIDLIRTKQGNDIKFAILMAKSNFRETINNFSDYPQNTILRAYVLGDRQDIPEEIQDQLGTAGIKHIIAISGMHITILSIIFMTILIKLGFWRGQAFYIVISVLAMYIIMIGFPASAIRAGLMAFIFLLAQKIGRLSLTDRAIVFAATAMLIFNPLLLRFDVGFQLSFIAVLGIIYFAEFFKDKLKIIPDNLLYGLVPLRTIISVHLSAHLSVIPLVLFYFDKIAILAIIGNVLVLPFVDLILILGLLLITIGYIHSVIIPIFSILLEIIGMILNILILYILSVVNLIDQIPFAALAIINLPWIFVVIYYLVWFYLSIKVRKKYDQFFLN